MVPDTDTVDVVLSVLVKTVSARLIYTKIAPSLPFPPVCPVGCCPPPPPPLPYS